MQEPSKDFREAVRGVIDLIHWHGGLVREGSITENEATDRILALCKEMLVPEKSACWECNIPYGSCGCYARNSARQHLLKQLGE